jgi:hypothetical protein
MGLFGKKEETKGYVPVKEVSQFRANGTSDKDIIKKLKTDGFSYQEIEKAMLQSLKQNVGEPTISSVEETWGEETSKDETPTFEDIYGKTEEPKGPSVEEMMAPGIQENELNPEMAIEELVEGVVNEKWEVFEKELKKLKYDEEVLMRQIKQLESMNSTSGKDMRFGAFERKLNDMETKLSDMEARINGMEKAFKQFLPSLTDNIRNLSNMIHEMKKSTGLPLADKDEEIM